MSYPDDNPKTKFGLKKAPVHLVPPALIRGAAEAWANGAEKYGPFNWREHKISSTVYYAACLRHLTDWYDRVDADDCAPDSGVHHLKHAVACLGMLLDTLGSDKLNDNRPLRCPALGPSLIPGPSLRKSAIPCGLAYSPGWKGYCVGCGKHNDLHPGGPKHWVPVSSTPSDTGE